MCHGLNFPNTSYPDILKLGNQIRLYWAMFEKASMEIVRVVKCTSGSFLQKINPDHSDHH